MSSFNKSLLIAAFATLVSSVCCLLPFILSVMGLTGAWIYYLTKFFRDIRVNFYSIPTPEIEYNIKYLDTSSPTYDVFISQGISLLY